jgi:magnesium-dependent phosphatase 1
MLWGGGAPFRQDSADANNTLTDSAGVTCRMIGDVADAWSDLHRRMRSGQALLVGVASRSDEPSWARECLRKFVVDGSGTCMMDVVTEERCEIYKGSKRDHFRALQRKTGVSFERMCFFDDDMANIRDVRALGVHCFHTPDGVTRELYHKGLQAATGQPA